MGYLGIQVLLSDYGRKLSEELCSPEAEAPAGAAEVSAAWTGRVP
jgi:hypothetical protein